jgi:hypothetical protein
MSLLKDVIITIGDALRLSSDLMRCKLQAQTKVVKRGVGRVVTWLITCLASLVLVAVGGGFLLYGAFVLLAEVINSPGAAGLIIGAVILLAALVVALIGRTLLSRP